MRIIPPSAPPRIAVTRVFAALIPGMDAAGAVLVASAEEPTGVGVASSMEAEASGGKLSQTKDGAAKVEEQDSEALCPPVIQKSL